MGLDYYPPSFAWNQLDCFSCKLGPLVPPELGSVTQSVTATLEAIYIQLN